MISDAASPERGLADSSQPAAAAFGLAMAALIMTIFGFTWLGWGFSVDQGFTPAHWIVFYLAFLALLAPSIQALRRAKASMNRHSAGRDDFRSRFSGKFKIIAMFEGAGCGVVVLLTVVFHRLDLLAAGISLVVGLHFLPVARLFRFPVYFAAGIAIVLCDLLSVARFRADIITLSVGVATGTILWITAIYALLRSRKLSRDIAAS